MYPGLADGVFRKDTKQFLYDGVWTVKTPSSLWLIELPAAASVFIKKKTQKFNFWRMVYGQ